MDQEMMVSMKREENRLKSFQNCWPVSFIKPVDLARAGLFYLGVEDKVQCAFCEGTISQWEQGTDPLREHCYHYPMCPFLLKMDPVSNEPPLVSEPENYDKRLETFRNWPKWSCMTPTELADSGFFYSGVADAVTCSFCRGSLGNWTRGDVAWVEHIKHFPDCKYAKLFRDAELFQSTNPKENEATESNYVCKICFEEGPRVAFMNCGHCLACPSCAKKLSVCPLCRAKIHSTIRIYFDGSVSEQQTNC